MKKKKRGSLVGSLFIIIVVLIIILGSGVIPHPFQVIAPPGWEIYNQIAAIRHNDKILDSSEDFTFPSEISGPYWKVDVDEPAYGVPTIQVQLGDIRHVDFTGREVPSDQPADMIIVERGNKTYYLDYHIYMMTVTMRTVADKDIYRPGNMFVTPLFEHETSWPYEGDGGFGAVYNFENRIGKPFKGGCYVKFIISPWKGFTYRSPPNSSYVLDGCWAGVMNVYVMPGGKKMGQVENQWGEMPDPDPGAPTYVKGALDEGNQVPMFKDDGSFGTPAPRVNWDPNVTPDERIESTVVLYLPVEMEAGAKLHRDWDQVVRDIYPCDVYIMYTLRIDVLTVHEFALQSAHNPPEPQPPSDWFIWFKNFWDGFISWLSSVFGDPMFGMIFILLLIVIILVVLAVFAPGVLAVISAMGHRVGEKIRGNKKRR